MLARALDQTSRTGQIMDPIADRLGLVAIVLTLALADLLPWAALAVIVVVDAAMAVLATRAALGGRISVSWLGKIRTFVLMASVFLLVAVAAWAPSLVPAAQALHLRSVSRVMLISPLATSRRSAPRNPLRAAGIPPRCGRP